MNRIVANQHVAGVSDETLNARRVAFIKARWHGEIVDQAQRGFERALVRAAEADGTPAWQVDVFEAPGAFEIPLLARDLARSGRYAAVVGAAFVIDGGIYRHEFVADTVVGALMQVQMDSDLPVLSVVLTPHHYHDSEDHRRFFHDHFLTKGKEAAEACLMVTATRLGIRAAA